MQAYLCVGAVSRRVVEEAAKLQVVQIVASRRQVDTSRGYLGMTQVELVSLVKRLSDNKTLVVRDHGGPDQGWGGDDGVASFDADIGAGFDGLHIDVCRMPPHEQPSVIRSLASRYSYHPHLEVGGEHDSWSNNLNLLRAASDVGAKPKWIVGESGTFVWADRQKSMPPVSADFGLQVAQAHIWNANIKVHNADFMLRSSSPVIAAADAYNLAPELASVEIDALLLVLPTQKACRLLDLGLEYGEWSRWFSGAEGTIFERQRCGVRYILESHEARELTILDSDSERYVRRRIANAIIQG